MTHRCTTFFKRNSYTTNILLYNVIVKIVFFFKKIKKVNDKKTRGEFYG